MFTPRTLEFLTENHLRGSREWFAEHKGEYQELVVRPLHELTAALTPTVAEHTGKHKQNGKGLEHDTVIVDAAGSKHQREAAKGNADQTKNHQCQR